MDYWYQGVPVEFYSDIATFDYWFEGGLLDFLGEIGEVGVVESIKRIALVPDENPPLGFEFWGGGEPMYPQSGTGSMGFWGSGEPLTDLN